MTYLGCLGICDPAEERVAAAVAQLGSQIAIWIVTGDQCPTAYYAAIDAGASLLRLVGGAARRVARADLSPR